MDSINQQQEGQHHQDLRSQAAIGKIKQIAEKAQTCFFCTRAGTDGATTTRPMSVQQVDESGQLWFLSATDSHKNAQIAADPRVTVYFQESQHSGFLTLECHATLSQDKAKIRELWEPILKTWFTGGVDDPRISVIGLTPHSGYYWDTKHGDAVAGVKMMIGAALGKTIDDSIEGCVTL